MDGYLKRNVYPALANWLGLAAAVFITMERAQSYAEAQKTPANSIEVPPVSSSPAESSNTANGADTRIDLGVIGPQNQNSQDFEDPPKALQVPLSEQALQKFSTIKTKEQICKLVEGKIVTYYDVISKVENCKQHQIEDPEYFNQLIYENKLEVVELPARLYRLIPFGAPLNPEGIANKGSKQKKSLSEDKCRELNGNYVTTSGLQYFFIENCKRRPFAEYYDLQEHNIEKKTITSISPDLLYRIPMGSPMPRIQDNEESLLMKMDGDVKWNLLARANRDGEFPKDNMNSLNKIKNEKNKDPKDFCKKFNNRVVTFYSQVFFLQECKKRQIENFSMNVQRLLPHEEQVVDLTPQEYKSIRNGPVISEKELIKIYKVRLAKSGAKESQE